MSASQTVSGTIYRHTYFTIGTPAAFSVQRGQASSTASDQVTTNVQAYVRGSSSNDVFEGMQRATYWFDFSGLIPVGSTYEDADFRISTNAAFKWSNANDPQTTSKRDMVFFPITNDGTFNFVTPTTAGNFGAMATEADNAVSIERANQYTIQNGTHTFTLTPDVVNDEVVIGLMQAWDFDNDDPFNDAEYPAGTNLSVGYGLGVSTTTVECTLRYTPPAQTGTPTIVDRSSTRAALTPTVAKEQDVGPTTIAVRSAREAFTNNEVQGGIKLAVPTIVARGARSTFAPSLIADTRFSPTLIARAARAALVSDFAITYNPEVNSPTYTVPNDYLINTNDSTPELVTRLRQKGDEPIAIEYAETITAQVYEFEDASMSGVLGSPVTCEVRSASAGEVECVLPGSGAIPAGRYIIVWTITWGGQMLTSQVPTDFFYTTLTVEG
jgi:hypothetical protein